MPSSIRVAIRVRPEDESTKLKGFAITDDKSLELVVSGQKHDFVFDKVLGPNVTQQEVFDESAQAICNEVLEGYNGCVFAYGQTGAGKTHTMSGPPTSEGFEDRGLCLRVANYLFERARRMSDAISIRLSVLEIYNETLTDLLREPPASTTIGPPQTPKLTIVDTTSGVVVPSLYILPVASDDDAYTMLLEAYSNRVVAEHQLNRYSSRSHVIYTFYITRTKTGASGAGKDERDPDVVQSKLHLVDLAGSERVAKTGSAGLVQKEANHINRSLSFLEQVVLALTQSKRDHIPYRQSKLTYLLKDSLGGNCHTYMIACVWPHFNHAWETLSTLRFSARMKCIENTPVRNSLVARDPQPARLVSKINALKRELAMRDTISGRDPWLADLTQQQQVSTVRTACNLVAAVHPDPSDFSNLFKVTDEQLDLRSLSQARLLFGTLRAALWTACKDDPELMAECLAQTASAFQSLHPGAIIEIDGPVGLTSVPAGSTADDSGLAGATPHPSRLRADLNAALAAADGTHASEAEPSNARAVHGGLRIDTDGAAGEEKGIAQHMAGRGAGEPSPSDDAAQAAQESFDEFKAGPGLQLHQAYEQVKAELRVNKLRQREIVAKVNQLKGEIDQISAMLQEMDPNDHATAGRRENLLNSLEAVKAEYRALHMEMQLCKNQVTEAQALKKRAMASLVMAFDNFTSGHRQPLP